MQHNPSNTMKENEKEKNLTFPDEIELEMLEHN